MIDFDKDYDPIESEDIKVIEDLIGESLPEDYKLHMLKYNGGSVPIEKRYTFPFGEDGLNLSRFHQIKHEDGTFEEYFDHKHDFLYPELASIGSVEGGHLAMAVKGENKGAIYVYSADAGPYKICESFTDFIDGLDVSDEDF